jgi:hypothetical protein
MRRPAIPTLIVCLIAAAAYAGVSTYTGTDWTPSQTGRFCIIAARVERVTVGDMGNDKPHVILLRPFATLAGNFDPSLHPTLEVDCYTAPNSSIRKLPGQDSTVLAAVALSDPTDPADKHYVVSAWCTFMPEQSALVEINGLDDPLYASTLEKLQKERAIAISRAATQPSTQPSP